MKNIIPDSTEKTLIKTVLKPQRDLTKERRFKRAYDTIARYSKDNHLKVLELLAIVVGLTFTIQAIERNTESNRVASREQLYASENIIGGREYADANTKLLSLYAKPSANVKDPKEYCRQLVEVVTTDPAILAFLEDKNPPTKQRAEIFYDIILASNPLKIVATTWSSFAGCMLIARRFWPNFMRLSISCKKALSPKKSSRLGVAISPTSVRTQFF